MVKVKVFLEQMDMSIPPMSIVLLGYTINSQTPYGAKNRRLLNSNFSKSKSFLLNFDCLEQGSRFSAQPPYLRAMILAGAVGGGVILYCTAVL